MTTLNQIADVLDAAADLIEPEEAWGKCHCASTAISHAAGRRDPLDRNSQKFFARFLGLEIPTLAFRSIWAWNDAPERTQTEVVETLRKAAQSARKDSK